MLNFFQGNIAQEKSTLQLFIFFQKTFVLVFGILRGFVIRGPAIMFCIKVALQVNGLVGNETFGATAKVLYHIINT